MYQKAAVDRKDAGGGVYSLQKELMKSPLSKSFNIVPPSMCLFKMKRFPEIKAGRTNVEGRCPHETQWARMSPYLIFPGGVTPTFLVDQGKKYMYWLIPAQIVIEVEKAGV